MHDVLAASAPGGFADGAGNRDDLGVGWAGGHHWLGAGGCEHRQQGVVLSLAGGECLGGIEIGVSVDDLGPALLEPGLGLDAHRDAVLAIAEQRLVNLDHIPARFHEPNPQLPVLITVSHRLVVAANGKGCVLSHHDATDDRIGQQQLIRVVTAGHPHRIDVTEEPRPAAGERRSRIGIEGRHKALQKPGLQLVVGVERDHELTAGAPDPGVA